MGEIMKKIETQDQGAKKFEREKKYDIHERTFKFAQRIIEISNGIPEDITSKIIKEQLVRSGTSVGANMEEADGALTKRDFTNKVVNARKEAKETKYWLKLIDGKYFEKNALVKEIDENRQIINILSAIINKTKGH